MPFTELQELIGVTTRKKISERDVFDAEAIEQNEPQYQLYTGIKSGSFTNPETAAQTIYNSTPDDNRFKLIKSRLKQRLMNVIFHLDLSKDGWSSEYQRALQEVLRSVAQVRLLIQHGAPVVAKNQAQRLLTLAIKHDITEPVVQLSRFLRNRSAQNGDAKTLAHYDKIHQQYTQRLSAEERAESIMDEFTCIFAASTDDHPEAIVLLTRRCKELTLLRNEHSTFSLTMHYYRLHTYTAYVAHNYEQAIQYGNDAIEYLAEHPEFSSKTRVAEFAHIVMNVLHTLCRFDEAERLAQRCFENYVPHSNQWYVFLSQYFVLAMHSGHYDQAMDIFRTAAVSALKLQPQHYQERWKMFAGYMLYLHGINRITLQEKDYALLNSHFKRGKFSFIHNYDLEIYTKDKSGMLIAILILELLYTIESGDANSVLTLQEKLRLYYFRTLKPEAYPRANAFYHIIQVLMQEEFNLDRVRKRSVKDLAVLMPSDMQELQTDTATSPQKEIENKSRVKGKKKTERKSVHTMEGLEIIRYETLCSIVFERIAELQEHGSLGSASLKR